MIIIKNLEYIMNKINKLLTNKKQTYLMIVKKDKNKIFI